MEKNDKLVFNLEKPVTGEFLFDTPLEGTHEEYGKWYMYKVKDYADQKEKIFIASKGLQKILSEKGPLQGRTFTITKVFIKDEHGNYVEKMGKPMTEFHVEVSAGLDTPAEEADVPADPQQ